MSSMTGLQIPSASNTSSAALNLIPYGSMPSTSAGSPSGSTHELSSAGKRKRTKSRSDYFSNFSPGELNSMMLNTPGGLSSNESASNSPASKQEKKLQDEDLLLNALPSQQQQLLQLHQVRSFFACLFVRLFVSVPCTCRLEEKREGLPLSSPSLVPLPTPFFPSSLPFLRYPSHPRCFHPSLFP